MARHLSCMTRTCHSSPTGVCVGEGRLERGPGDSTWVSRQQEVFSCIAAVPLSQRQLLASTPSTSSIVHTCLTLEALHASRSCDAF
jgi:hypothetical protein